MMRAENISERIWASVMAQGLADAVVIAGVSGYGVLRRNDVEVLDGLARSANWRLLLPMNTAVNVDDDVTIDGRDFIVRHVERHVDGVSLVAFLSESP